MDRRDFFADGGGGGGDDGKSLDTRVGGREGEITIYRNLPRSSIAVSSRRNDLTDTASIATRGEGQSARDGRSRRHCYGVCFLVPATNVGYRYAIAADGIRHCQDISTESSKLLRRFSLLLPLPIFLSPIVREAILETADGSYEIKKITISSIPNTSCSFRGTDRRALARARFCYPSPSVVERTEQAARKNDRSSE